MRNDSRLAKWESYKASLFGQRSQRDTATDALLHRLHLTISLHGVIETRRGVENSFLVEETATLLSLPRDLSIGERVLVMVTASTRTRFHSMNEDPDGGDRSALHQTNLSIILPGSIEFSSLLSLSYSTMEMKEAGVYHENTDDTGLVVHSTTADALEQFVCSAVKPESAQSGILPCSIPLCGVANRSCKFCSPNEQLMALSQLQHPLAGNLSLSVRDLEDELTRREEGVLAT